MNKKIFGVQFDFFNFCNAKCWFCPVAYDPVNKSELNETPLELVEKMFFEVDKERKDPNGIIVNDLSICATAHYSEVLLYRKFKEMLELARKYNLQLCVSTNGVPLTKEKIDIIKEYKDIVKIVAINIPAFEKEVWVKRTGFMPYQFDVLMKNLEVAGTELNYLGELLIIGVNGISSENASKPGKDFMSDYDLDPEQGEWNNQFLIAKSLFKNFNVVKEGTPLHNRAGKIKNIITHNPDVTKKVIGCNMNGDRTTEWLHISPTGDVYVCANDYRMEYSFGNLQKSTLREIWNSDLHKQVIEKFQNEVCSSCALAITDL